MMGWFLSHAWSFSLGVATTLLLPTIAFYALERWRPAEHGQRLSHVWRNLKIGLLFTVLAPLLGHAVAWVIRPGHALFDLHVAPTSWPRKIAATLIALFVYDTLYYWTHRLQHRVPWLWRQHRVHHSTRALNAGNTISHHFTEVLVRVPLVVLPMTILVNAGVAPAGICAAVVIVWGFFLHANLRLELGPLSRVVAGPQLHRLHHSRLPEHRDCNFAAYFPMLDVLFGTYTAPKRGEFPVTGVEGYEGPRSVIEIIVDPFLRTP